MGALQTWTYDAPTGTYKNHDVSERLRFGAIAECKVAQFVDAEPGYGKKQGESVTITRISNITEPTNGRITEGVRMPEREFTISTIAITVSEWGQAVPFTNYSNDLAHFDLPAAIERKLMDNMKLTMDTAAADALQANQIKAIPDGSSSLTFDTDGTASTQATVNLNVYHLEELRDYLHGTLQAPPYMDGDYIMIASTKACRGIKRDPDFEKWNVYAGQDKKFNSEIGKIEGIRVIESNHTTAFSNTLGSGSVLGEAVVFGQDAVSMAVAEDPHLRMKQPDDYGRDHGIAWYGILEFKSPWQDSANAGEARVIHITSS
jgi:N4-gp56 family major capsid protein